MSFLLGEIDLIGGIIVAKKITAPIPTKFR
jgi:hypothetical protein